MDIMETVSVKIIVPKSRWWKPDFEGLAKSGELFLMLVRRQFLARYQQSVLGIAWAVLNPLAQLFIFWLLFGLILKVPSNNYPYVPFAFAGVVLWSIFSSATLSVSSSLQEQMSIVSKVYFPRIILPFVNLCRAGIDALIGLLLLFIVNACYGFLPGWRLLFIPFLLFAALLCGLALGLILAGPIVRFRDLSVPLTYTLQLMMYITPVMYPISIVPSSLTWVIMLNPMYWVIEWGRWIFLGQAVVFSSYLWVSAFFVVCALVSGWFIFSMTERFIVDVQ
ncbi:ABC-2 type transporter [uncultured delta proteobacterium]|uniref:Transport permease protein n=1 Tax=uncultured delta proteobacterium TaxID=34034 RepID=A0A212KGV6_9DELT|nr:ABC-2 type transporter [uncultured delta proteobacterium]